MKIEDILKKQEKSKNKIKPLSINLDEQIMDCMDEPNPIRPLSLEFEKEVAREEKSKDKDDKSTIKSFQSVIENLNNITNKKVIDNLEDKNKKTNIIIKKTIKQNHTKGSYDPPADDFKKSHSYSSDLQQSVDKNNVHLDSFHESLKNTNSYINLIGARKLIVDIIYDLSVRSGNRETPPIAFAKLHEICGVKKNSLKVSKNRLMRRNLISCRLDESGPKTGRASCSHYRLCDDLFNELNEKRLQKMKSPVLTKSNLPQQANDNISKDIPQEVRAIELEKLNEVLSKVGEFFTHSHLNKLIYKSGGSLTLEQVQKSIEHFTYGLKHWPEDKRYSRKTKIASLYESLESGQPFVERRYLNEEGYIKFLDYKNQKETLVSKRDFYLNKWINTERDKKKLYFQSKLPSNHFYGENEFIELATKHFLEVEWQNILKEQLSNKYDKNLLDKFEVLIAASPQS